MRRIEDVPAGRARLMRSHPLTDWTPAPLGGLEQKAAGPTEAGPPSPGPASNRMALGLEEPETLVLDELFSVIVAES